MSKWSEVPLYHALTHMLSTQQDPWIISKAFKNIFGPSCLEQSSGLPLHSFIEDGRKKDFHAPKRQVESKVSSLDGQNQKAPPYQNCIGYFLFSFPFYFPGKLNTVSSEV